MTTMTLDGNGILSGEWDSEAIDKRIAEDREKDRAYAEQERVLKEKYERLDGYLGSLLRAQLEIEGRTAPITDEIKADMDRFRRESELSGYPWLPANGSVVAEHLLCECGTAAEAERLLNSISTYHRAMRLSDPASDVLPRAAIRFFRDNEQQEQPEPKRRAKASKLNGASNKENAK